MYLGWGMSADPEKRMLADSNPPPEEDLQNFFKWINHNLNKKVTQSSRWYFVTALWMQKFQHWVRNRPLRSNVLEPGPVDNTGLRQLDDVPEDGRRFARVSDDLWSFITNRYGILNNREPVWRYVIGRDVGKKESQIEYELIPCTLIMWDQPHKPRSWKLSHYDNHMRLMQHFRKCFGFDEKVIFRIWMLWDEAEDVWDVLHDTQTRLFLHYRYFDEPWRHTYRAEVLRETIYPPSVSLPTNHLLKLEWRKVPAGFYRLFPQNPEIPPPPGLIALQDIQSESYWRHTLVLLFNIPSIRNYYLSDAYLRELNPENPLGRKGEFAILFGDIIKHFWNHRKHDTLYSCDKFKAAFQKANVMFDSFDISDIMAFMLFLMDSLHEDCNRVKDKPKVELPDTEDRPVEEVAAEFWEGFKKRNDSVIVDTFFSQIYHRSECKVCGFVNNTFEALPGITLPIEEEFSVYKVVFRYYDVHKPLRITRVRLNKSMSLDMAHDRIGKALGVDPFSFILGYLVGDSFDPIKTPYSEYKRINRSLSTEKYLIALEHPKEWKAPMWFKDKEAGEALWGVVVEHPWMAHANAWRLGMVDEVFTFKVPYLIHMKLTATYSEFMNVLEERLEHILPRPAEGDEWWVWKSPEDDEYDAKVKKIKEAARGYLCDPGLENKDNTWEKNGKHYYFRLFDNSRQAPNTDEKKLIYFAGSHTIQIQVHKLYARKYLHHLINLKPNVEVVGDWWLYNTPLGMFTLDDCFELWNQTATTNYPDNRMCKRCEKYQYHILKTGFWTLPNYLLVNVDRYVINHNDRVHGGFKKDAMLKIPEYGLDLRPYMTGPLKDGEETLYDFKANVVHLGYSILRAYYLTFFKYEGDGCFYAQKGPPAPSFLDDFQHHHGSYLLLYKRRGFEEFTFPEPEGGTTPAGPLDFPREKTPSNIKWGHGSMMMMEDDYLFKREEPKLLDVAGLGGSILRLKSQGFSTGNLERIQTQRKAIIKGDTGSFSKFSKVSTACELDSDEEEMGGGATGKGYWDTSKEKEEKK